MIILSTLDQLAKNIKDNAGISYEDDLTNKCSQSMFLTPVAEVELQTVIKKHVLK